jgi:thiamine-phosphate pyrophosphorylase
MDHLNNSINKDNSLIIGITNPHSLKNEAETIIALLEEGIDYIHIRKPQMEESRVLDLVKQIPQCFHSRMAIHYHHHLAQTTDIGGLHESNHHPVTNRENKRISKSCHSIKEAASCKDYNYLFLSPIFDSISKEGYHSNIDRQELTRFLRHPHSTGERVIALGGISVSTIPEAHQMGFSGIALLGALWAIENKTIDKTQTIRQYKLIQQTWQNQLH